MTKLLERDPIAANETERTSIGIIDQALKNYAEAQSDNSKGQQAKAKLVGPKGEEIEIPEIVFNLLRRIVNYLARGKAISLIPVGMILTTQEAADLLNVSRPHLVKLVDEGKIPYKKVGTHRRIKLQDLMAYKANQDAEQRRLLAEMTQFSQEMGLYEDFDND